jgi:hypothetical protein
MKKNKMIEKKKLKNGIGIGLKRSQNASAPTDDIDNKFLMPETTLVDGNLMGQGPIDNFPTPLQYGQYMQGPPMWPSNNSMPLYNQNDSNQYNPMYNP